MEPLIGLSKCMGIDTVTSHLIVTRKQGAKRWIEEAQKMVNRGGFKLSFLIIRKRKMEEKHAVSKLCANYHF